MKSKTASMILQNEKGMATIETIPLLVIFVVMLAYTFGAFGIVHTGILNSIAARTYAFETMRNRSNVTYFRDIPDSTFMHYRNVGARLHTVSSEQIGTGLDFLATERAMQMGLGGSATLGRDEATHMQKVPSLADSKRNQQVEVNPAWVLTQYGMCLNPKCGDSN